MVVADCPAETYLLLDPGDLPHQVRARVTRSVAYTAHHPLPGGAGPDRGPAGGRRGRADLDGPLRRGHPGRRRRRSPPRPTGWSPPPAAATAPANL